MDNKISDIFQSKADAILLKQAHRNPDQPISDTHKRLITLARVDAALDRLDEGTFGLCLSCHCEIALEQLVKDPSIDHCEYCK